jgi:hypothetical protein
MYLEKGVRNLKRVVLSIVTIIFTIICVVIMLSEGDTETSKDIEIKQINENNSRTKAESTSENRTKEQKTTVTTLKAVEKKDVSSNNINNTNTNTNTNNNINPNKSLKQSSLEEMVVYKVPKQEIFESISREDKTKILSITNKISPSDYARINNCLKSEMGNSELAKIIGILKTRLSHDDYSELREIAVKYIYIEKLEKVIGT